MNNVRQCFTMKRLIIVGCIGLLVCIFAGCGTVRHNLTLNPDYKLKTNTSVEVGPVSNQTGRDFDVDIERLLSEALTEELGRADQLWDGGGSKPHLKVTSQIVEYRKGDAFKRWLLPRWGSTVLTVHCDLSQDSSLVGSAEAKRTVSAGGGYSIGAWRTIFAGVAKDIVSDIQKKKPH